MHRKWWGLAIVAVALGLTGCAEVPQAEVDAVKQAIDQARTAEAAEYAPESLRAAEDARAAVDAELKVQEDKFALTRSYEKTKQLAADAKAAGEKAARDAAAAKERARQEAAQRIADVRQALIDTRAMLEKAPKAKGSEADIEMLSSDLSSIEASLPEIDAAFSSERFLEANTKAAAAAESVAKVRAEIEEAVARVQQARGRR